MRTTPRVYGLRYLPVSQVVYVETPVYRQVPLKSVSVNGTLNYDPIRCHSTKHKLIHCLLLQLKWLTYAPKLPSTKCMRTTRQPQSKQSKRISLSQVPKISIQCIHQYFQICLSSGRACCRMRVLVHRRRPSDCWGGQREGRSAAGVFMSFCVWFPFGFRLVSVPFSVPFADTLAPLVGVQ